MPGNDKERVGVTLNKPAAGDYTHAYERNTKIILSGPHQCKAEIYIIKWSFLWEGNVALYAAPNPFLWTLHLNKICLNQVKFLCFIILKKGLVFIEVLLSSLLCLGVKSQS